MLTRTRLIAAAAVAGLIVSGAAPAMAASTGHTKKVTHAAKPAPQAAATRTAPATTAAPVAGGGGRSDRSGGRAASF